MLCGWEGNRRSGVALAMRHRLQWFIHLRDHGLRKGDKHPAYTPHGVWHSFTFLPPAFGVRTVRLTSKLWPVIHFALQITYAAV